MPVLSFNIVHFEKLRQKGGESMPMTWQIAIMLLCISNLITAINVCRQFRTIRMLSTIASLQSKRIDMLREKINDSMSKM